MSFVGVEAQEAKNSAIADGQPEDELKKTNNKLRKGYDSKNNVQKQSWCNQTWAVTQGGIRRVKRQVGSSKNKTLVSNLEPNG